MSERAPKTHLLQIAVMIFFATILQIGIIGGCYYAFVIVPGVQKALEAEKQAAALEKKVDSILTQVDTFGTDLKGYQTSMETQLKNFKSTVTSSLGSLGFKPKP